MQRKKTNKILIILGLVFILISILIYSYNKYKNYKIEKETNQVIESIFNEEVPTPEVVVPEERNVRNTKKNRDSINK